MSMLGTATVSLRDVAMQLRGVAEQLERGQAQSPLMEQAEACGAAFADELCLVLLGLSTGARDSALERILGRLAHNMTLTLHGPAEFIEIVLQEHGYSLESPQAGRQDFDSPDALVEGLRNLDGTPAWHEPVLLALAAVEPHQRLRLLVPRDAASATESAGLLGRLNGRAPLLVLAAAEDHEHSETDRAALRALAPNTAALLPMVVNPVPGKTAPSWLRELGPSSGLPTLATLSLVAEGDASGPPVLDAAHPMRRALGEFARAQRLSSLSEMVQDRVEHDSRQLQSRQKRESRLERSSDGPGRELELRQAVDRAKQSVGEGLTAALQALREGQRRAQLPNGAIGALVETLQSSLRASDLQREEATGVIRLSLKPEVLQDFRRRLSKLLRSQLNEECVMIRDMVDEARRAAEAALAELGAPQTGLPLATPDVQRLWEPLAEMLQLNIKYRGELPRRGFLQRLGEGRRVVFVALMALSLIGSFVGFNVRQAGLAGIGFLVLFIGAVGATYRTWQRDELRSLDKEIERVRDSIASEFSRVVAEIVREKQMRQQQALDELKRDAQTRLDTALRETQAARGQANEMERREARARLKLIEQRLKDLAVVGQQLVKVRQGVADLAAQARDSVRKAVAAEPGARA